jgi:DNA-binding NarL/FixJ family response regulator
MNPTVVLIGTNEYRASLKRKLKEHHFVIGGELADSSGIRLLPHLQPDIVVVDVASPAINPMTVLPRLAALPNAPAIVAIGATTSAAEHDLLLELGATTVVAPDALDTLVSALECIHPPTVPAAVAAATTPRWSWLWRGVDLQPELRPR